MARKIIAPIDDSLHRKLAGINPGRRSSRAALPSRAQDGTLTTVCIRWRFVLLAAACGSRTEPGGDFDASSKPLVRCSVRGPTALASRQGPLALAVDATHVYWLNEENPFSTLELRRIGKAGGLVETVATLPLEDANVQIAVSADDVYVVTGTNLVRVAKDGGSATTVARLPMKGACAFT